MAEENIEGMISVSARLAPPTNRYFLLRAKGNSMNQKGIDDGDLVLIKQQKVADNGDLVVALIDDRATIKEFQRKGSVILLIPRSDNPSHQPIIMASDFLIQGRVVATIPKIDNTF